MLATVHTNSQFYVILDPNPAHTVPVNGDKIMKLNQMNIETGSTGRPISKRTAIVRTEVLKFLRKSAKRTKPVAFTAKVLAKNVHADAQEARVAINWLRRTHAITSIGHAPQDAPGRPEIVYVVERRNRRKA